MQLQFVKSLIMLYETQNMTRASERLFITQQCLSRQISSLEHELDTKLFTRRRSGMKPTDMCVRLYPEFKKMADSYDKLKELSRPKAYSGEKVSIAVSDGMSSYLDIGALAALIRGCGFTALALDECPAAECSRKLRSGEADMAFLLEPFDDTMLEHVLVRQDHGYIAMLKANPLAAETGPIPFAMLHGQNTVSGSKTNCAAEHLNDYCEQTGVYPHFVGYVSNITGYINNLREDDVAVTILGCTVRQITNPDIVVREVIEPRLIGRCHCCIRKDTEKADMLRELMHRVKEHYDENK